MSEDIRANRNVAMRDLYICESNHNDDPDEFVLASSWEEAAALANLLFDGDHASNGTLVRMRRVTCWEAQNGWRDKGL